MLSCVLQTMTGAFKELDTAQTGSANVTYEQFMTAAARIV